ncbi:MAG TPA: hypothetical protein VNN80_15265, partial [Polyangiaceae bacterium]|nr:hypothetical protein [Polyangiaceae bacterium]
SYMLEKPSGIAPKAALRQLVPGGGEPLRTRERRQFPRRSWHGTWRTFAGARRNALRRECVRRAR